MFLFQKNHCSTSGLFASDVNGRKGSTNVPVILNGFFNSQGRFYLMETFNAIAFDFIHLEKQRNSP